MAVEIHVYHMVYNEEAWVWLVILQKEAADSYSDTSPTSSHDSTQNYTKGEECSGMEETENSVSFVYPGMYPERDVSCICVHAHC
jgi:hypothetical protein